MTRLIKYFLVFVMIGLMACSSKADESSNVSQIIKIYNNLVSSYEQQFSKGDFKRAYSSAKELLKIDPSDTVSYLRMAVVARELDLNLAEVKNTYNPSVAESTKEKKALKSLANALLSAPKR